MTDRPHILLAHHLKTLKLPTFLREYEKVARQCAAEGLDHVQFLARLVELELIDRERRTVERRIKAAKFPVAKSLDSFDFKAIPALNKAQVLELARCEWIERRENVIALGPSGTGKTHVALGLGLAACQRGLSTGFTTAAALVHELMEARDERRLLRLQKQMVACTLLIIDELGFVPLSKTGAELLFELISQRYERGATLITSNLPFDEWTGTFGSERLNGALLDRLTHHVNILEMNGDSYGLSQSRARRPLELCMAPLPAPAEKPSHRISESQSHAKLSPPAQAAVFCPALWPNLQPALTLAGRGLYQCNRCKKQTSPTASTIFHATKLPLTLWFAAIHLIVTEKNGISSVELGRRLGVKQPTAWAVKHKIMAVMARREGETRLTGRVEMDDAYLGGVRSGGKRGRGAAGKTPFVAAVSTSPEGRPRKLKLAPVKGFRKREIARGAKHWLAPGAAVVTDGLGCWSALDEIACSHQAIRTGSGQQAARMAPFKWVNTTLGNIKCAITGTYRKLGPDHAGRYLASFAWRYNRRYQLQTMIPRFVHSAARTEPMPYRLLIAG